MQFERRTEASAARRASSDPTPQRHKLQSKAARSAESKAAPRDGRQEGRSVRDPEGQSESQASVVPARATQGAQAHGRDWTWVEATVWSERMLAALGNGVRGGKFCASRRSNRGWGKVSMIIFGGPILSSRHKGCSP